MEWLPTLVFLPGESLRRRRVKRRSSKISYAGLGREGINWEIGSYIYTQLYIKQITNEDLLFSIGNSSQYSVMIYMRKDSKKECIYT